MLTILFLNIFFTQFLLHSSFSTGCQYLNGKSDAKDQFDEDRFYNWKAVRQIRLTLRLNKQNLFEHPMKSAAISLLIHFDRPASFDCKKNT